MKRTLKCFLGVCLVLSLAASAALALDYPTRQITTICPYDPGGGSDSNSRMIAAMMQDIMGQTVLVENISGAGTMLGHNVVQQRPADGYTIGSLAAAATPWILNVTSETPPPWNPDEDFIMVARATSSPAALGILVDKTRWDNFSDFINEVKKAPPKTFNMGLQGPGAQYDPMMMSFQELFGVEFNVIYYAGSANLQTDILSGDLDACFTSCNIPLFVNHENFKVMCLFGDSVPDDFPIKGLPFLADYEEEFGFDWDEDQGYMGLASGGQYYYVKKGTDQAIIDYLESVIEQICTEPETRNRLFEAGRYPDFLNSEDTLKVMKAAEEAMQYWKDSLE